jgi:hypothetical protein
MAKYWPAILRLIRVGVAQGIGALIEGTSGIAIPYFGITVGAVISGLAKLLRDKFKWEWLPV